MARLVLVDGKGKPTDGSSSSTSTTSHRGAGTEGEAAKILLEANGYLARRQEPQNNQWEFACPFHEEPGQPARGRKTNFYLDRKTSKFTCHSATCGERGNLQVLEKFFGLERDPAAYAQFKSLEARLQQYQAALNADRRQVFYQAGLTDSTIDRFRIGFDEQNKHGPCYVIPYLEGRRPHAIRYYSPDGCGPNGSKYWWETGTEQALFNASAGCGDETGRVFICFTPDTEVLTQRGWVVFPDLRDDDQVAQYHADSAAISFVVPSGRQVFSYTGPMVAIQGRFLDLLVTPDHRVLGRYNPSAKRPEPEWQIRPAKDFVGKQNIQLPVAGIVDDGKPVDELHARLAMAWLADGVRQSQGHQVSWRFRKQRKRDRLHWLLDELDIPWKEVEYPSTPGWHTTWVQRSALPDTIDTRSKSLSRDILDWSLASRQAFLEEGGYWDGDRGVVGWRFFTGDQAFANLLCEVAAISGYGSTCRVDTRPDRNDSYVINLNGRSLRSLVNGFSLTSSYTGNVYCVTVPTGLVLVRRNGKTGVSGQCEGEKKAMLLEQWGYNAVAVPGAQSWKREWTHFLNHAREIFLLYDNDNPEAHIRPIEKCGKCRNKGLTECTGHNPGQEEAAKRKDELGFRAQNIVLPLPDGARKTDINEYVMRDKHSKSDFEILLMGGDKASPFLVRTLGDIFTAPPDEVAFLVSEGLLPKGGRLLISGAPKVGKLARTSTPVLTPYGWTTMGEIRPGDQVIGVNGAAANVTHVHPQGVKKIYRVTMSDGSWTECGWEHLWTVRPHGTTRSGGKRPWRTVPTSEIAERIKRNKRFAYIPTVDPVAYAPVGPLPVDAYALGLLIGDGGFAASTPTFTKPDIELHEALAKALPDNRFTMLDEARGQVGIAGTVHGINPLTQTLRNLGLWGCRGWEKFVPEQFLRAPIADRLAVLQGLLDTDGWVQRNSIGNTSAYFGTSSERLKDHVVELAESLGGTVRVLHKPEPKFQDDGVGRPAWTVRVRLPRQFEPFRLARKLDEWRKGRTDKDTQPVRRIVSVDYVDDDEAVCITIDRPDGLYVTERFIVTHNSIFAENLALSLASGIPFLRKFEIAEVNSTPGVRTLLLDREVSERSLYDRLKMLVDDRPGYMAAMDNLFVDHKFRLVLDTDKAEEDMCNLIFANGAQVVILDTAYKFFQGDMNSQASVNKMFSTLDRVIERTGVSIILTHHHRKGTLSGQNGGPNADQVVGSFLWTGWPNGTVLLNFKERRVDQPFNTICSFVAFRDAAPPEPLVLFRSRDSIAYTSVEQWVPDDEEQGFDPTRREKLSVQSCANTLIQAAPVQYESFLHMAAGRFGCKQDTVKPVLAQVLADYPDFERSGAGTTKDPYILRYRPDHIGEEPSEVEMVSVKAVGFYDVDMFPSDGVNRDTGEIF